MRRILISTSLMVFFSALLLTSCNRDEPQNNGNNNGNPIDSTYNNQEYPSTAHVIRRAVADIDGNIYDAVQIGSKVWMAENLRTTRYADGTAIPKGNSSSSSPSTIYRYSPDANEGYAPVYGYLYNWPAVMHGASSNNSNPSGVQGICPNGWHVPSKAEWEQLTSYVSSQSQYVCGNNGANAKALASSWGWKNYSGSYYEPCYVGNGLYDNNATGFSAFPAGSYPYGSLLFTENACFWTATEKDNNKAMMYRLDYDYDFMYSGDGGRTKDAGFSVRCVRD